MSQAETIMKGYIIFHLDNGKYVQDITSDSSINISEYEQEVSEKNKQKFGFWLEDKEGVIFKFTKTTENNEKEYCWCYKRKGTTRSSLVIFNNDSETIYNHIKNLPRKKNDIEPWLKREFGEVIIKEQKEIKQENNHTQKDTDDNGETQKENQINIQEQKKLEENDENINTIKNDKKAFTDKINTDDKPTKIEEIIEKDKFEITTEQQINEESKGEEIKQNNQENKLKENDNKQDSTEEYKIEDEKSQERNLHIKEENETIKSEKEENQQIKTSTPLQTTKEIEPQQSSQEEILEKVIANENENTNINREVEKTQNETESKERESNNIENDKKIYLETQIVEETSIKAISKNEDKSGDIQIFGQEGNNKSSEEEVNKEELNNEEDKKEEDKKEENERNKNENNDEDSQKKKEEFKKCDELADTLESINENKESFDTFNKEENTIDKPEIQSENKQQIEEGSQTINPKQEIIKKEKKIQEIKDDKEKVEKSESNILQEEVLSNSPEELKNSGDIENDNGQKVVEKNITDIKMENIKENEIKVSENVLEETEIDITKKPIHETTHDEISNEEEEDKTQQLKKTILEENSEGKVETIQEAKNEIINEKPQGQQQKEEDTISEVKIESLQEENTTHEIKTKIEENKQTTINEEEQNEVDTAKIKNEDNNYIKLEKKTMEDEHSEDIENKTETSQDIEDITNIKELNKREYENNTEGNNNGNNLETKNEDKPLTEESEIEEITQKQIEEKQIEKESNNVESKQLDVENNNTIQLKEEEKNKTELKDNNNEKEEDNFIKDNIEKTQNDSERKIENHTEADELTKQTPNLLDKEEIDNENEEITKIQQTINKEEDIKEEDIKEDKQKKSLTNDESTEGKQQQHTELNEKETIQTSEDENSIIENSEQEYNEDGPKEGNWEISYHMFNVGQGDCALLLIKNYNGNKWIVRKRVLIDAGNQNKLKERNLGKEQYNFLNKILFKLNLNKQSKTFDAIIISHWDADHYKGLLNTGYTTDYLFCPQESIKHEFIKSLQPKKTYIGIDEIFGTSSKLKPVSVIDILFGEREFGKKNHIDIQLIGCDGMIAFENNPLPSEGNSFSATNRSCLSCLISVRDIHLLTCGDLGINCDDYVRRCIHSMGINQIQIIKVNHHGSETTFNENKFINEFNHQYILFSYGKHDRYKHPSTSVLACALTKFKGTAIATNYPLYSPSYKEIIDEKLIIGSKGITVSMHYNNTYDVKADNFTAHEDLNENKFVTTNPPVEIIEGVENERDIEEETKQKKKEEQTNELKCDDETKGITPKKEDVENNQNEVSLSDSST
ncbi:hypothetical protein EHI8A_095510 [Entamoeba histolytica HM-1:IMSS-B]|uniref:Metallo-beta-lactamase domain-containing protein n=1 Tax=Entamoeba histolytica HM-1:IMSS-B TaxID=885319 RepID=M3TEP7_ENTH1|nr:hypothetical protein EHI8A_095510 [Entamoeba histolytica HM-1:IMSS-B]